MHCLHEMYHLYNKRSVCLSVGGSHRPPENKGKSLKLLVFVLGLLLHVLSHTQSKQGTFTLSALPMASIKLRTFKIHGWNNQSNCDFQVSL
jgi:hypothetical protein